MTAPLQRIERDTPAWYASPFYCPPDLRASLSAPSITAHAATGCLPCTFDSRNLAPPPMYLPLGEAPPEPGEGCCPRCRAVVQLKVLRSGRVLVLDADGQEHRHLAVTPIYLTARARREPAEEPAPRPTPLVVAAPHRTGFRVSGL